MYLEISETTFKRLLKEYIEEFSSTEDLHALIMKLLKMYSQYNECYFDVIKTYVDRQHKKGIEE